LSVVILPYKQVFRWRSSRYLRSVAARPYCVSLCRT
jgi:hypothetical protein